MEDIKDKTAMQKTQIFNVIILDRSGSMQRIRQAAVDGFNETLVGISRKRKRNLQTHRNISFHWLLSVAARFAVFLTKYQLVKRIH